MYDCVTENETRTLVRARRLGRFETFPESRIKLICDSSLFLQIEFARYRYRRSTKAWLVTDRQTLLGRQKFFHCMSHPVVTRR